MPIKVHYHEIHHRPRAGWSCLALRARGATPRVLPSSSLTSALARGSACETTGDRRRRLQESLPWHHPKLLSRACLSGLPRRQALPLHGLPRRAGARPGARPLTRAPRAPSEPADRKRRSPGLPTGSASPAGPRSCFLSRGLGVTRRPRLVCSSAQLRQGKRSGRGGVSWSLHKLLAGGPGKGAEPGKAYWLI